MEEASLIQQLMEFSLSRQEAIIYLELLKYSQLTGYEIAKYSGISRSNVYGGLKGLQEKGGAELIEGTASKYIAVPIQEFCKNRIRRLEKCKSYLVDNILQTDKIQDGYITIVGYDNIKNKAISMIESTHTRFYLAGSQRVIGEFLPEIKSKVKAGIQVKLISDYNWALEEGLEQAKCYVTDQEIDQIRLITDSAFVLTGIFSGNKQDSCLYSGQKHLVNLIKEAIGNKIKLVEKEGKLR